MINLIHLEEIGSLLNQTKDLQRVLGKGVIGQRGQIQLGEFLRWKELCFPNSDSRQTCMKKVGFA